jgi:transposase
MKKKSNTVSFKNQVFYIGIDVHKRSWTVTIRTDGMVLKTYSMKPDPGELARHLKRNYPDGIYKTAYEAGFCGFWIHKQLMECGIDNIVIHAADIPTTNKEKVNKTDKIDSKKLARELENNNLNSIYVPGNWEQQLRSLCRLRARLVSHSTRLKNRIKGHLAFYGIVLPENHELTHWSANFIKHLESECVEKKPGFDYLRFNIDELKEQRKRILTVTQSLRAYIRQTPIWDKVIRNLISIPGVAFLTAATLYTEIIDIERFKDIKKLASFVGLVPSSHSSGEHEQHSEITPRKNPHLRYLIVEASWIAVRTDPSMLKAFTELTKRMKKSEAIIRIARKLLNRIRFVWRNETQYKCFC